MSADTLIIALATIIAGIMGGGVQSWLSFKLAQRTPEEKPNKEKHTTRNKITLGLVTAINLLIPIFEISVFLKWPDLSTVVWLCVGISSLFFNAILFIINSLMNRVLSVFNSQSEINKGILEKLLKK